MELFDGTSSRGRALLERAPVEIGFGPIEVTEMQAWQFPFQNVDHLRNSYPCSLAHGLEVKVGIDIEVSHLEEVKVGCSDELDQSLYLLFAVREAWKDEKIDRSIDTFGLGDVDRFNDIVETVPSRTMVAKVEFATGTVERDSDAIQSCFTKFLNPTRITSIRI